MRNYIGILDKICVIKTAPLLVSFTLVTIFEPLSCIVSDIELAYKLMFLNDRKYTGYVVGYWNLHDQFIVKTMVITNPDDHLKKLGF